jgi:hypothetical protein
LTINVHISTPHAPDDKATRVRTFAVDGNGIPIPERDPLSTVLVAKGADSFSTHLYAGVALVVDEVTLPPKPAPARQPLTEGVYAKAIDVA